MESSLGDSRVLSLFVPAALQHLTAATLATSPAGEASAPRPVGTLGGDEGGGEGGARLRLVLLDIFTRLPHSEVRALPSPCACVICSVPFALRHLTV